MCCRGIGHRHHVDAGKGVVVGLPSPLSLSSSCPSLCDIVTNKQRLGLGDYALDEHEWKVLEQLQDVLAVRQLLQHCNHTATDK